MLQTHSQAAFWYAVHTRSNFEYRVAEDLIAKRIEPFLPCYEEVHQWKDRRKKVNVPLFPGYIFIRLQDCPELRIGVLRTSGVVRILGNGGQIEPIPEHEITAVRRILESRIACRPHPYLREGSRVRVVRGALTGVEGLFVRVRNDMRLVISISLLSRSVAAEVDSRYIEPIQTAAACGGDLRELDRASGRIPNLGRSVPRACRCPKQVFSS